MISRVAILSLLMAAFTALLSCGRADTHRSIQDSTVWDGLRSAIVYVRVAEPQEGSITVDWQPAWISDSQRERLYWYGPAGQLLNRIEIEPDQPNGSVTLPVSKGRGDYRLVIPGYSFRRYDVTVPAPYRSVIEPEKLHFSMEAGAGKVFWTGPLQQVKFRLKSHADKAAFALGLANGEEQLVLHSAPGTYRDHAALDLDAQRAQVKLTLKDGGKFSFWLDDAPNIFSQTPEHWFEPRWLEGEATFSVSGRIIGDTTKLGTYTEFAPLPSALKQLLRDVRPAVVHSYIFEDVMAKHQARDDANNRALLDTPARELYGLLSRTTRDSLPDSAARSAQFLEAYLNRRFANRLPLHIIAFVDEPNLRYRSYEAYEAYHLQLAQTVRSVRQQLGKRIKIAAPESSRMINGPTNKPRRFQSGFSWAEKLLSRHWETVDVISWHMWQYRYLDALDQYPETILAVDEMNSRLAKRAGQPAKALSISQTNLGSGPNTSTYQQNTHYAGLWWASVAIQSIATGKLDNLIWFKAVDEGPYGKGLLEPQNGQLVRKPIAAAMIFINDALLPLTLEAGSSAHEVDIAAMQSTDGDTRLLCVNKSRRNYTVFLDSAAHVFDTLDLFGPGQRITKIGLSRSQQNGTAPIILPPETLCIFHGRAK